MRTDTHKPSAINPEEYSFVGLEYVRGNYDLSHFAFVAEERDRIREHRARTGGHWSNHVHGGTCMICGAWANYTVVFHHEKSNTYIRTGDICAEKMSMGDAALFQKFRRSVKDANKRVAGKAKAKATLEGNGMGRAWEIYKGSVNSNDVLPYEERTVASIVGNLIRYGSLTERQENFVASLLRKIETRPEREKEKKEREARWAAEKAVAKNCPTGRVVVGGEVLKTAERETHFGLVWKMLVKTDDGYMVWSTIPSAAPGNLGRGDRIKFRATLTPSKDDPKFGFAKRPSLVK